VVSFSGEKITYQHVITNLNILDYEYYFRLTSFAMDGDAPSMLLLFNEVLTRGFDARNFINGYAGHLRDLMVCKDPATVELMEVGAGFREKYLSQSVQVPLSFLYEGLEICNQADIQFRASRNQRLTIELALVRLARLSEAQKKKANESPGELSESSSVKQTEEQPEPAPKEAAVSEPGKPEMKDGNGASRTVRKPGISIKASLSDTASMPKSETIPPEVQKEEDPPEARAAEADPAAILDAWEAYAVSVEKTKPRVSSTLQTNKPEWEPGCSRPRHSTLWLVGRRCQARSNACFNFFSLLITTNSVSYTFSFAQPSGEALWSS
jgi:DNA polymerase III gamma/tau subunit